MNLVLITGGGSGIGRATAEKFLKNGWSVALVGRDPSKFAPLAELHPEGRVLGFELNVARPLEEQASWSEFESQVLKQESLTAVVNNAGFYQPRSFLESTDATFLDHWNVNFMGAVRILRAAWPHLLERKRASVVNISSTLGMRPVPGVSAYASSKAALQSLTEALALEGAPHIRVNTICPGIVETPIHSFFEATTDEAHALREQLASLHPLERLGSPEDIATWAYRLCTEEASWVTGSTFKVDGGIHLTSKG